VLAELPALAVKDEASELVPVFSAKTLVRSRREPLKPIFMVKAAQNGSRDDLRVPRKSMAGDRRSGESGRRGRQARPEGGMRTAAIIMEFPRA